jgi:hypothetical protein
MSSKDLSLKMKDKYLAEVKLFEEMHKVEFCGQVQIQEVALLTMLQIFAGDGLAIGW